MKLEDILLEDPKTSTEDPKLINIAKIGVQLKFWKELDKTLKETFGKKYTILDVQKYSLEAVSYCYEEKRRHYGIFWEIATPHGSEIVLYGIELWGKGCIIHGFSTLEDIDNPLREDGARRVTKNNFKALSAKATQAMGTGCKVQSHWWLAYKKLDLDFIKFSNPTTELVDPQKRKDRIVEIVKEVEHNITEFQKLYFAPTSPSQP